ncbi:MAG: TetR/AcrR family transcriptional regulator [Hungatella sp.]
MPGRSHIRRIGKLSIRRLASESGIAIGTVYNYFPSKADLIAEVLEDF